jgi:Uma2 family endonuclease
MPRAITAPPAPADLPRIRWNADQYENLFSMSLLPHGKYELLEGDVVEKVPIKFRHARIITRLLLYFNRFCDADALGSAFTLAVDAHNMPEPDFAVLTSENPTLTERGYVRPEDVRLVVEVGDSTVASDVSTKAGIYAGANIPEYWVIDVTGRRLIVHDTPVASGYANITEYADTETVAPTFAPAETTPVFALLS